MYGLSPDDTVTSRLRYWSVRSLETPAFVYVTPGGQRYAYTRRELFSISSRAATWLRQRGVCKNDVILCLLPTSPEQTFVAMGAALLGATIACATITYRDGSDIWPLISLGDVTTVLVDQTDEQSISALKLRIKNFSPGSITCLDFPSLKSVVFCNRYGANGQLSFLEAVANQVEAEPCDVRSDDTVVIFPTSGSSGQSKLVRNTHWQVLRTGLLMCKAFGYQPGETVLNASSFAWITGYPGSYLVAGLTRVVPYVAGSVSLDRPKFLWSLLAQEKVTEAFMLPTLLKTLIARADLRQSDVTWFARSIATGSCPVRKDVSRALETLTSELRVLYGSTEMGFLTCKIYTDSEKVEDFNCGKPLEGQEVKVVDANLQEVPPGTKGELMIRNKGWFSGYLGNPDLMGGATLEEGWFMASDLAYVNTTGDVFVEGRSCDVISIGGWPFYPQLLESHLMKRPGVHDVSVIPIPDNDFDNRPCVCVQQDSGPEAERVAPDDILRACAEYFQVRFLQVDKRSESFLPKVCLVFDTFPVNPNGKVRRKDLRALALKRLGLDNES